MAMARRKTLLKALGTRVRSLARTRLNESGPLVRPASSRGCGRASGFCFQETRKARVKVKVQVLAGLGLLRRAGHG